MGCDFDAIQVDGHNYEMKQTETTQISLQKKTLSAAEAKAESFIEDGDAVWSEMPRFIGPQITGSFGSSRPPRLTLPQQLCFPVPSAVISRRFALRKPGM